MPIEPGDLDRRITLRTAVKTQDEDGAEIRTWGGDDILWAQWFPGGTRETWQAQQRLGSYIDGVYRIYFRDEPKADLNQIIGHDGRTYDIKPCIEIGRREAWDVPVVAKGE